MRLVIIEFKQVEVKVIGVEEKASRPAVGETAAVKMTPRQAASSVEASEKPGLGIPLGTGMYQ